MLLSLLLTFIYNAQNILTTQIIKLVYKDKIVSSQLSFRLTGLKLDTT